MKSIVTWNGFFPFVIAVMVQLQVPWSGCSFWNLYNCELFQFYQWIKQGITLEIPWLDLTRWNDFTLQLAPFTCFSALQARTFKRNGQWHKVPLLNLRFQCCIITLRIKQLAGYGEEMGWERRRKKNNEYILNPYACKKSRRMGRYFKNKHTKTNFLLNWIRNFWHGLRIQQKCLLTNAWITNHIQQWFIRK